MIEQIPTTSVFGKHYTIETAPSVLTAGTALVVRDQLSVLCDEILINIAEKADADRRESIVRLRLLSRRFKGVGAEVGFRKLTFDGK